MDYKRVNSSNNVASDVTLTFLYDHTQTHTHTTVTLTLHTLIDDSSLLITVPSIIHPLYSWFLYVQSSLSIDTNKPVVKRSKYVTSPKWIYLSFLRRSRLSGTKNESHYYNESIFEATFPQYDFCIKTQNRTSGSPFFGWVVDRKNSWEREEKD